MTDRRTFLAGGAGTVAGALIGAATGRELLPAQGIPAGPRGAAAPGGAGAAVPGLTGDGQVDDGAVLHRHLAALAESGGGDVRIAPGRYRVEGGITVPRSTRLDMSPGAVLTGPGRVTVEGEIGAGLQQVFDAVAVDFAPGALAWALPQWWGAVGDGEHDDTAALRSALNARNVFLPAGCYRTTAELVLKNRSTVVGVGNSWSPTPSTDSWIRYDGPADTGVAVLRASTAAVGEDPSAALSTVHLERVTLDGGDRAGYGLYSVYCTNDSSFAHVTARRCAVDGVFVSQQWYTAYSGIVARDNAGRGIAVGRVMNGWNDHGVNGIRFENLRAANNGAAATFDEVTRPDEGCGILFRPGAGTTVHHAVAENNHGAGFVYELGPRCSNGVHDLYLEGNGVEAQSRGAGRAWGLIVIGHANARANRIDRVYLHGAIGERDAQSVRLSGPAPAAPLPLRDLSFGHHLHADWPDYRLDGYIYHGLSGSITGSRPGSDG